MKFPDQFTWGMATSSYQIEGAHNADGKGPSIWDAFSRIPGRILGGDTGDLACDHYHRFRDDVKLMASLGVPAYRFSISWPRVLPTGRGTGNPAGIKFYSDLIDALLEHGIEPWVTLYHWDLPLALQMENDGWLNPQIADDFTAYAKLCFSSLGDRVKKWITFNEPWVISLLGHGQGIFAPGRKSTSEPYLAAHNILRAHAKTVQCFRTEFHHQNGKIGITNNCDWRAPLTDSPADQAAAQRAVEFFLGWFADPIFKSGDYPPVMRELVGDRLPVFTPEESTALLGSADFFGLNHYTAAYAAESSANPEQTTEEGISADPQITLSTDPAWKITDIQWPIVPWGCKNLLQWIANRYNNPPIFITENGCAMNDQVSADGRVYDKDRISFYHDYLTACHEAIQSGVNLRGYFAWSFMDNMEWVSGYRFRFGLVHVDRETLARTPKSSALWFSQVIQTNELANPTLIPVTTSP